MNNEMQAGENPVDGSTGYLRRDEHNFPPMSDSWPPIPVELEYLIEPAIHYGRKYQFSGAIDGFLGNAEESTFETLAGLAERVRLSTDYSRFLQWSNEVDDVVDYMVDDRYPYTIDISEHQRKDYLRLINPDMAERMKEKALRRFAEANDRSDAAERRKEMRGRLLCEANDQVHHMDIYFLFGLLDAYDMEYE